MAFSDGCEKWKISFMNPFYIVRKYSLVEYIMNAYRMKLVSYFKNMCLCYDDMAVLPKYRSRSPIKEAVSFIISYGHLAI